MNMISYCDLLFTEKDSMWNEYTKLESIIDILQTYNHPAVPLLIPQLISLKNSKLQQWYSLYYKIDTLRSYPKHYMKYMFLTHEINNIWS
jgi:hypothetical protein